MHEAFERRWTAPARTFEITWRCGVAPRSQRQVVFRPALAGVSGPAGNQGGRRGLLQEQGGQPVHGVLGEGFFERTFKYAATESQNTMNMYGDERVFVHKGRKASNAAASHIGRRRPPKLSSNLFRGGRASAVVRDRLLRNASAVLRNDDLTVFIFDHGGHPAWYSRPP